MVAEDEGRFWVTTGMWQSLSLGQAGVGSPGLGPRPICLPDAGRPWGFTLSGQGLCTRRLRRAHPLPCQRKWPGDLRGVDRGLGPAPVTSEPHAVATPGPRGKRHWGVQSAWVRGIVRPPWPASVSVNPECPFRGADPAGPCPRGWAQCGPTEPGPASSELRWYHQPHTVPPWPCPAD